MMLLVEKRGSPAQGQAWWCFLLTGGVPSQGHACSSRRSVSNAGVG
jgi:hypothetical protein